MAPLDIRAILRDEGIGRRLRGVMAVAFLALILAGGAAAWMTGRSQQHIRALSHTYEVENAILDARQLLERGETTRRGYLLAPGQRDFLVIYRNSARALPPALKRIRRLTSDNPVQVASYATLLDQVRRLVTMREESIGRIAAGDVVGARAAFDVEHSALPMASIRTTLDHMAQEERRLLASRERDVVNSERMFYVVLVVAGILLAVAVIASLLTVLGYTRDLARSHDALRALNAGLEDRVTERTADLTRANEEIQRFAYIVSHDLRSPLVNVMGFTAELESATGQLSQLVDRVEADAPQLLTDDARFAAREDLPEAIGFIRTSTQKMDRLINAILALSRQGRRVLAPESLDLAQIIGGIRDSMQHRLDETGASVEIEGALPEIIGDRVAVEQILSNLIENSVKYRHPDRPVAVKLSGGTVGDRIWVSVADNGRGIDPRDHERVFDLFRRSGTQDQPGEGIGLAHVRALAYRLGGTITLRSALGEGATFRLSLPATLSLQDKS